MADFVGLAPHVQDLSEFPDLLKLGETGTPEAALRTKMIVRRVRSECKAAQIPRPPQSEKKGELRPSGHNPHVSTRLMLMKIHPKRNAIQTNAVVRSMNFASDIDSTSRYTARCRNTRVGSWRNNARRGCHMSRNWRMSSLYLTSRKRRVATRWSQPIPPPLSTDKTANVQGGKLRLWKPNVNNQYSLFGPSFLAYLKTLLYGYALCSVTICYNP